MNKSLHKLIAFEMLKQVVWNLIKGYRFVIVDAPLLFEVKIFLKYFKYKIVVYCDERQQLDRLLNRNKQLTENEAKQRIESQINTIDKVKLADFCIDNSKELEFTRKQVEQLYEKFESSKAYLKTRIILIAVMVSIVFSGIFMVKKLF